MQTILLFCAWYTQTRADTHTRTKNKKQNINARERNFMYNILIKMIRITSVYLYKYVNGLSV